MLSTPWESRSRKSPRTVRQHNPVGRFSDLLLAESAGHRGYPSGGETGRGPWNSDPLKFTSQRFDPRPTASSGLGIRVGKRKTLIPQSWARLLERSRSQGIWRAKTIVIAVGSLVRLL